MATMLLSRLLVRVRSHETVQGSYSFSPINLKIGAVNSVRYERVVYNARLDICLAGGKKSDVMMYMVE